MKPASFKEHTFVIARGKQQLPAHVAEGTLEFTVTVCWHVSLIERLKLLFTGRVWHQIATYGAALQTQKLMIEKPELRR